MQVEILPLTEKFHMLHSFREQIAVLYFDGLREGTVRFIRSWVRVCQPNLASFDPTEPGEGGQAGWEWIDNKIENNNVRGIFHTHPSTMTNFSDHDTASQIALAKTYGRRVLWHGVQACGSNHAYFKCVHMSAGQIFVYQYEPVLSDPTDAVITLPAPPFIGHSGNVHTLYGD